MKEALVLFLLAASACDPTSQPADGGAVDGGMLDGGTVPPAVCPGHRLPCSQSLPALNCSPTSCERIPTGALCCLEVP